MHTSRFIAYSLSIGITVLGLVSILTAWDMAGAQTDGWVAVNNPTTPGGIVDSVAISPSNPDRLYTLLSGLNGEGLFRSDNAALSWQPAYTFTVAVDELGINPANPDIVYAGGGDGLYRSLDSGLSWTQTYTVGQVLAVISPTLFYAGGLIAPPDENCFDGHTGMARSLDGGGHWQMTPLGCLGNINVLAVDPGNPKALYIGTSGVAGKPVALLYSQDGGITWISRTRHGLSEWPFQDLLIDPDNSSKLYASSLFGGFSISYDGGETWQRVPGLPSDPSEIAWSAGSVYVIPAWSMGSVNTYRSDDGGGSWWVSLNSLPAYAQELVADPSQPGRLYAGLYGYGIYKTVNDGGIWVEQNDGLQSPVASVVDLARSPDNPNAIYAAADQPRGGIFYSQNLGLTWSEVFSDSVMQAVAVNLLNPEILYAGGEQGLYESRDGGQEWWREQPESPSEVLHIQAIKAAPGSSLNAYAVDEIDPAGGKPQGVVYKRQQMGDFIGWALLTSFPTDAYILQSLAINPHDPSTIFVGGASYTKNGIVYRSIDGGASWTEVLSGTLESIYSLAIDPHRPDSIYAGSFYGVYHSSDGGETWQLWLSGLKFEGTNVYALAVDMLGVPYAGTGDGVYRWDARQNEWTPFGLQGRRVYAMEITAGNPQILIASTEGSLWRLRLPLVQQLWLPFTLK